MEEAAFLGEYCEFDDETTTNTIINRSAVSRHHLLVLAHELCFTSECSESQPQLSRQSACDDARDTGARVFQQDTLKMQNHGNSIATRRDARDCRHVSFDRSHQN
mmetsp:Transcript_12244/g.33016  ORF Transcript_12244/g.33016 Transcript_12244/m.33016 type:complete len:105 (-) Transcript_12244:109-423(-)